MKIVLLVITMLILNGCWLMPYKEDFSCNSDLDAGKCGMVRDNYNLEMGQDK